MAKTKSEKVDLLAEHTHEVCVKVLVSGTFAEANAAMEELLELAEARPDYVTCTGAYADSPRRDDLEHVADDVTDEALERLTS